MKKKILLGASIIFALTLGVVGMSAFEAHIINVTAKIENALTVPIDKIMFGTVFPQEELDADLNIALSESFLAEGRVDDVEYFIRQKPKCGWTIDGGTNLLTTLPTATGHVNSDGSVECPDPGNPMRPDGAEYGLLPSLCEYLSKHKNVSDPDEGQTEVELDAFHQPWVVDDGGIIYNDASGRLAKSEQDVEDAWVIDLKVPCFGDYCAQDWESFVRGINPDADPAMYVQDIANEHKVFGCDLWVEVTEVSESNGDICSNSDVMLVLDKSGSIESGEMASLKDAAKAFVSALIPVPDGVHIGQSSFAFAASLDTMLTNSTSTIFAGIDALGLEGFGLTNLEDGILTASLELISPRDRDDATVPDFMVIITDGEPTESSGFDPAGDAMLAATAAKALGTTIYVLGVGTTVDTTTYLRDNIATSPAHYFDVADYNNLEIILDGLAACTD